MHVGLGLGLTRGQGGGVFSPSDLFQSGDILLWYDPADLSTMFTNTTGTTQVAADGDSVALMLDKGQWGGKTFAEVMAAQPELAPSDGSTLTGWTTSDSGGGSTTSDGTSIRIQFDGSGSGFAGIATAPGLGKTYRVEATIVVASGTLTLQIGSAVRNFTSGTYTLSRTIGQTPAVNIVEFKRYNASTAVDATVSAISIKEIPGYHRVQATGTSMPKYKTDGTLHWLLYDGTDDSYQTPTITWGTKQVAHAFGIMANSDTTGVIAELSANYNSTAGAFLIARLTNKFGASTWNGAVAGGYAGYESTAYAAPTTKVIVSNFNLAGNSIDTELVAFRINGASDKAAAQGIYTDANPDIATAVLNFGRRNNASLPLNGREYQSIIRSRMWTNAELSRIERFIATKSGVTI